MITTLIKLSILEISPAYFHVKYFDRNYYKLILVPNSNIIPGDPKGLPDA